MQNSKTIIARWSAADRQHIAVRNAILLIMILVVLPSFGMFIFALAAVFNPSRALLHSIFMIIFGITLLTGAVFVLRAYYRQVKLGRLQTDFVSHISHDLRTPLTSIRLFVDTLEQGRTGNTAVTAECLRLLSQETERLSQMVERMLDFARMEAGRRVYEMKPIAVSQLCANTAEAFRARYLMQSPQLAVELAENTGDIIADAGAVIEALLNLLDNAVKYADAKNPIILSAQRVQKTVVISVSDSGPGIPLTERRRIFDKFYRVDNLLSRKSSGSGLGLTIVRHIANAHRSKVTIESELGHGSRFSLIFKSDFLPPTRRSQRDSVV